MITPIDRVWEKTKYDNHLMYMGLKSAAKRSYTEQERQDRRFADLRPSVGDSGGSSSTNRTLFPTELCRPVRGCLEEVDKAVVVPARSSRLAKGVRKGVAGVVDSWARTRARAARLDGDVVKLGVAKGLAEIGSLKVA